MDKTETTNGRSAYHHGDLKTALVKAGIELLEEVGLEKLSLRGIAARVGVSHTAPKNHFNGLGGLLSAIAAEGFRRHKDAMTEGIGPEATKQKRLRAASDGYVRFALENPALFRLMFSSAQLDTKDPALSEAGKASFGVLMGISEGLDWSPLDGSELSKGKTELMLWSLVHGYAHLMIAGEIRERFDNVTLPATAIMPYLDYAEDADHA